MTAADDLAAHTDTRQQGGQSEWPEQPHLETVPLELDEANLFVARWHRHHEEVTGHKFSIGCVDEDGEIRGCAIVGRPVAQGNQDGWTLEVLRVATDGCDNACSHLYAAAWRAAKAQGFRKLGTYTLVTEPGTSLKAAGWVILHQTKGRSWNSKVRPRVDRGQAQLIDKNYWLRADATPKPKTRLEKIGRVLATGGLSLLTDPAAAGAADTDPGPTP